MDIKVWADAVERILREVDEEAYPRIRLGEGRQAIEGEDAVLRIDVQCEEHIVVALQSDPSLPRMSILSTFGVWFDDDDADVVVLIKPFENATIYDRMCPPSGWQQWSCLYSSIAVFDEHGEPRVGAILDFVERVIHIADDDGVTTVSVEDGTRTETSPIRAETTGEAVLASNLVKERPIRLTQQRAGALMRKCRSPFVPASGACVGAVIATGKLNVSGYVLGHEILSETVQHLPFIKAAGLRAAVVHWDGVAEPFTFDPREWRTRHDELMDSRMYVYVLAATQELLDEMVEAIQAS